MRVYCIFYVYCRFSLLGVSADISFQNELIARINAVETQGQQQTEKIQLMESRFEEQDQRLAAQEATISDYKQRVANLEQTVIEIKLKQDHDFADIDHYKQRVADLEQTVVELKLEQDPDVSEDLVEAKTQGFVGRIQSDHSGHRKESVMAKRALLNEGPVAFHATIKAGGEMTNLAINQKIIFPDVMENLGGGYQNQHGLFVAPQPGVYIFSTSVMADNSNHVEITVHLMKNGHILANSYAHGDSGRHDQGSVTVVTQLVAGDEVWVSVYAPDDASLWGNYYDSFMGCLVVPENNI